MSAIFFILRKCLLSALFQEFDRGREKINNVTGFRLSPIKICPAFEIKIIVKKKKKKKFSTDLNLNIWPLEPN